MENALSGCSSLLEFVFTGVRGAQLKMARPTMLADPDTLSTLRTSLLQPRPDPPRRASDEHVRPVPTEERCYVVSVTAVRRSVNCTGYLSYAVGHEHVGHQLYSCKG